MISDKRLEQALRYLAETDEAAAKAKAYMLGLEKQEKTVIANCFISQDGSIESRKQNAYLTPAYRDWKTQYKEAVEDYEIYRNKRNTEILITECWRTIQANQRKGNL